MWYQELEKQVVPAAYEAAKAVCAHVHHSELQLENGSIKIVVGQRPTEAERTAIDAAVRQGLSGQVHNAGRLRVRAERGFPLLYTSHLDLTTQHAKVVRDLHDITDYPIRVEQLEGLRAAYTRSRSSVCFFSWSMSCAWLDSPKHNFGRVRLTSR